MERLLYVALTRARHTLVLAVDHEFFKKSSDSIHSNSLLKWLRADTGEPNEQYLADRPAALSACPETTRRQALIPREETFSSHGQPE